VDNSSAVSLLRTVSSSSATAVVVVLPVAAAPEFSVPLGHDSSKLQLLLCCSRPAT